MCAGVVQTREKCGAGPVDAHVVPRERLDLTYTHHPDKSPGFIRENAGLVFAESFSVRFQVRSSSHAYTRKLHNFNNVCIFGNRVERGAVGQTVAPLRTRRAPKASPIVGVEVCKVATLSQVKCNKTELEHSHNPEQHTLVCTKSRFIDVFEQLFFAEGNGKKAGLALTRDAVLGACVCVGMHACVRGSGSGKVASAAAG